MVKGRIVLDRENRQRLLAEVRRWTEARRESLRQRGFELRDGEWINDEGGKHVFR